MMQADEAELVMCWFLWRKIRYSAMNFIDCKSKAEKLGGCLDIYTQLASQGKIVSFVPKVFAYRGLGYQNSL